MFKKMKFAIIKNEINPSRDQIALELIAELKKNRFIPSPFEDKIQFILNFSTFENPKSVARKAQNEFVISLLTISEEVTDIRYACYNMLIKTLSNLLICIRLVDNKAQTVYCITPEVGFYHFPYSIKKIYESILPIATARLVINNKIQKDLPEKYKNTPITDELRHYGAVLDTLGVLPVPFPIDEVLSQENIRQLYRLFKIKGISYGNLSAREYVLDDALTFWMTARGVNKARLQGVGSDILLVTGYNAKRGEVIVRVPADASPKIRVSVDAIEHYLIYEKFPQIGAIVHVHAWMDGIISTKQNFPCGSIELAQEVVDLLHQVDNPGQAVIGLKNHGITITGHNLTDIFLRIEGKLQCEVPMMA